MSAGVETVRVTVPMKPFKERRVIVAVPDVPILKLKDETLVASETSGLPAAGVSTFTSTVAVWLSKPSVPVIVTV
jgi:hypothetical protein